MACGLDPVTTCSDPLTAVKELPGTLGCHGRARAEGAEGVGSRPALSGQGALSCALPCTHLQMPALPQAPAGGTETPGQPQDHRAGEGEREQEVFKYTRWIAKQRPE